MRRHSVIWAPDTKGQGWMPGGFPLSAIFCMLWVCFLPDGLTAVYSLEWDLIAGGGGLSTVSRYTLVDSVGQPDAGIATSEALRWEAGFIPGLNLQPGGEASSWTTDEDTLLAGTLTGSDLDGDLLTFALDTPPANGKLDLRANGSFTYTAASDYNGADSFTFKVNDGEFDSTAVTALLTVIPVNDPPAVAVTLIEQTVQYSDPISQVSVTAGDKDSPGSSLAATTAWGKQGDNGSQTAGLPDGLGLALTDTTASGRTWTLYGLAQLAPGEYLIHVTVTDDQAGAVTTGITLRVTPEDARANYTGALFASTASASSSFAIVTLSATIQDITAVLGDPQHDGTAGDICNATVTFVNRDNKTTIVAGVPVGLVSLADPTTGTATYNWRADIGNADSQDFTVGIIVENWYSRNVSVENTIVTVSRPLASDFITGGGYLLLDGSAGLFAGDPGTKANFGFNVKYNKSVKNLQGRINIIVRSAGRVYQAKGNVMSSLSIVGNQATFNGKASIVDITDPLLPISIDGNATLQVVLTDNGDVGTTDKIAFTVWNKGGGLWFASSWNGSRTVEQSLAGGNLVVRSARKPNLAALPATEPIEDEPLLLKMDVVRDPATAAAPYPFFVLRFPVVPGTDYALERSTDLVNWTHLTTVMSFTDAVDYFDTTDSAAGCQFYRVRAAGQKKAGLGPETN